ncbi:TPA: LOW QUALITY PROTEIN: hypothetical protein N0F65_001708 [Lagenidium giganteum]|uniref:Uncharacterized protein n=1 Tax=Lagenidium giganteum TaxID=4803 RepID=A0AAV2YNR3_9STRA|nr:TPA: LOW QUALITY PROTEIN: hypothetical protein N0F65_001708 [Lagenidium giganteum]
MSGFSYPSPSYISSIYNPAFYSSLDASGLYLSKNEYRLSYLTSSWYRKCRLNISRIRNLSSTTVTGTLQTAAQRNITSLGTLTAITGSGNISGTLTTAAQPNITSLGTLTSISCSRNISGTLTTAAQPNITSLGDDCGATKYHIARCTNEYFDVKQKLFNPTNRFQRWNFSGSSISSQQFSFTHRTSFYMSGTQVTATAVDFNQIAGITAGTASASKALVLNSSSGISGIASLTATAGALTSLTVGGNTVATTYNSGNSSPSYQLDVNGSLNSTIFYINASQVTSTVAEPNYNAGIALGTFQTSKTMTLDSSGRGIMGLATSDGNCLRFYGNTVNRETMNLYRVDDTNGLVLASRTTPSSNNKTYPPLNLISTDNPSSFTGSVSATSTSADLLNITWNDKPSVGFNSQILFNIGNTQPSNQGILTRTILQHLLMLLQSMLRALLLHQHRHVCILCLDTINKMMFNTNTPYSSSYGTAPVTLKKW